MPSRRAFLTTGGAILGTALAGCTLSPSEPSTESYPATTPNTFFSFDWAPDQSVLTVTFERGNRLTTENTERLSIITEDGDERETVWVGPTERDPAATFPLTPKATVAHELSAPAETRIIWTRSEEARIQAGAWRPEVETEGANE